MDHALVEKGVRLILKGLDCDTKDRNYAETPERYARALAEMFSIQDTEYSTFIEDYSDFILLRGHTIFSLCPHHLLPVRMDVSVAYIPNGEVLGLSKLARVLNDCNSGPVLQEAFTREVVDRIEKISRGCHGAACLVFANHACMQMRGVRTQGDVVSYKLAGDFLNKPHVQDRFFQLCSRTK
jgi:GTP cyclohydrolase IA